MQRKHSKLVLQELGGNKKMKESGFIIPQGIPSHSWMQWGLDATLNRYGIRPGRQWDGVNHSLMVGSLPFHSFFNFYLFIF